MVELADSRGGQLENRVNFILDEFGNFSAIPNFAGFLTVRRTEEKSVSTCSYSGFNQLNEKYGDNTAQIILDNAYIWCYLKTSSDITAEKISRRIGNYTTTNFSESNSSNGGSSNISTSSSMNLGARPLLTPDEILRINRPYLLVMTSGKMPAMTNAPDLSRWYFNKMYGMGNEEHNRKLREKREAARVINEVKQLELWDIADVTREVKKMMDEEKRAEIERQRAERFRNF